MGLAEQGRLMVSDSISSQIKQEHFIFLLWNKVFVPDPGAGVKLWGVPVWGVPGAGLKLWGVPGEGLKLWGCQSWINNQLTSWQTAETRLFSFVRLNETGSHELANSRCTMLTPYIHVHT